MLAFKYLPLGSSGPPVTMRCHKATRQPRLSEDLSRRCLHDAQLEHRPCGADAGVLMTWAGDPCEGRLGVIHHMHPSDRLSSVHPGRLIGLLASRAVPELRVKLPMKASGELICQPLKHRPRLRMPECVGILKQDVVRWCTCRQQTGLVIISSWVVERSQAWQDGTDRNNGTFKSVADSNVHGFEYSATDISSTSTTVRPSQVL